jgi:pimeloyl-ACP methyl ester carboxylesterase/DNA-binding SARP family transcriptional activator
VTLTIRLLGPFRVEVEGRTVGEDRWSRRDAASLVKVLALQPDKRLHREQVMDLLWPGLGVAEATPRLHKAAHFARRALAWDDAVVLRDEMVALFPGTAVTVDVEGFERAAEEALADGSVTAAAEVLDRYPGDPLPAEVYADWAGEARDRLLALRYRLLGRARRWRQMIALAPVDERPYLELMRELARAGDRTGALAQFEALERALRRELGASPSAGARRLRDQVREEDRPWSGAGALRGIRQRIRFCRSRDGVRIACAEVGEGSPLVKAANYLTHLEYDWESPVWRHWLEALAAGHRFVRYDERGCGLSDWDIDDFSLEAWVSDLEAVVDGLRLERFALLGISQGGAVAVAYAVRHPERVTHLILYGAYAVGRFRRSTSPEQQQEARTLLDLMRLGWGQDNPAFRQTFTTLFMPDATLGQMRWFNELQRRTTSPQNAVRFEEAFYGIDVAELARRVTTPTLILHARGDAMIPFEEGRRLATLIPDSGFVPLEGRNHILLETEPAWARFVEEVRGFIDETPSDGPASRGGQQGGLLPGQC